MNNRSSQQQLLNIMSTKTNQRPQSGTKRSNAGAPTYTKSQSQSGFKSNAGAKGKSVTNTTGRVNKQLSMANISNKKMNPQQKQMIPGSFLSNDLNNGNQITQKSINQLQNNSQVRKSSSVQKTRPNTGTTTNLNNGKNFFANHVDGNDQQHFLSNADKMVSSNLGSRYPSQQKERLSQAEQFQKMKELRDRSQGSVGSGKSGSIASGGKKTQGVAQNQYQSYITDLKKLASRKSQSRDRSVRSQRPNAQMFGFMGGKDQLMNVPGKEKLEGYAGNNKRGTSVNVGGKFNRKSDNNIKMVQNTLGQRTTRPQKQSTRSSKDFRGANPAVRQRSVNADRNNDDAKSNDGGQKNIKSYLQASYNYNTNQEGIIDQLLQSQGQNKTDLQKFKKQMETEEQKIASVEREAFRKRDSKYEEAKRQLSVPKQRTGSAPKQRDGSNPRNPQVQNRVGKKLQPVDYVNTDDDQSQQQVINIDINTNQAAKKQKPSNRYQPMINNQYSKPGIRYSSTNQRQSEALQALRDQNKDMKQSQTIRRDDSHSNPRNAVKKQSAAGMGGIPKSKLIQQNLYQSPQNIYQQQIVSPTSNNNDYMNINELQQSKGSQNGTNAAKKQVSQTSIKMQNLQQKQIQNIQKIKQNQIHMLEARKQKQQQQQQKAPSVNSTSVNNNHMKSTTSSNVNPRISSIEQGQLKQASIISCQTQTTNQKIETIKSQIAAQKQLRLVNESGSGSQYQAIQQTFNSSGGRQANGGAEVLDQQLSNVTQFENLQLSNERSRANKNKHQTHVSEGLIPDSAQKQQREMLTHGNNSIQSNTNNFIPRTQQYNTFQQRDGRPKRAAQFGTNHTENYHIAMQNFQTESIAQPLVEQQIEDIEQMHCHIVGKIQKLRAIASDLENKIALREQAQMAKQNEFGKIDSSVQLMGSLHNANEQQLKELNVNFDETEIQVDLCDGTEILGRDY